MNKEDKIATVRRITVDERLSEDLIRLEIYELKKLGESGEFKDEPDLGSLKKMGRMGSILYY